MTTPQRRARPTYVAPIRLRVDIFDRLMSGAGFTTIVACADALGIDRSSLYALRNGGGAHLDVAMHIAQFLNTSVEVLFERAAEMSH